MVYIIYQIHSVRTPMFFILLKKKEKTDDKEKKGWSLCYKEREKYKVT
jgi:hypothetical protein